MKLWHHGIDLAAVKDPHKNSFDHIIKMVSQCNLIAAQLLCMGIEVTPPHSGAEVTGGLIHIHHNIKNIRVKDPHRDIHKSCIFLNELPVFRLISRIHHNKFQFKLRITLAL